MCLHIYLTMVQAHCHWFIFSCTWMPNLWLSHTKYVTQLMDHKKRTGTKCRHWFSVTYCASSLDTLYKYLRPKLLRKQQPGMQWFNTVGCLGGKVITSLLMSNLYSIHEWLKKSTQDAISFYLLIMIAPIILGKQALVDFHMNCSTCSLFHCKSKDSIMIIWAPIVT